MSHLKVTTSLQCASVPKKLRTSCNNTLLRIFSIVFGLLLLVGMAVSYIYQVNTIATSATLGCVGGLLILAGVIQCTLDNRHDVVRSKNNKKELLRKTKEEKDQPQVTSSPVLGDQSQPTDEEIIQNLVMQGYSMPIDEGSDGRCLFCSIAPQITDTDIKQALASEYASYFEGWETLSLKSSGDDKLDRLRQMALAHEEKFLDLLPSEVKKVKDFNLEQKNRIFELYKDMFQELNNINSQDLRKQLEILSQDPDRESVFYKQLQYCKENFSFYKKNTQRKYNYAGTSEFIAIGCIFKRKIKAFGRDLTPTSFDHDGNVLPYYSSCVDQPTHTSAPFVIFQCWGGGHYKRLVPPTTII